MKKYRSFIFVVAFIALLLTQYKLVMPFVYKVISSDLFLVQSNDQASQLAISTPLTNIAFHYCNDFIKSDLGAETNVIFPDKPTNAWTLGNYQYLISAEITITGPEAVSTNKKYACRITYNNGDDQAGINDFSNWSIIGVSGLKD